LNPTLRKISSADSANEIADLLQKHIGEGGNQSHCKDACEVLLQRIKDGEIKQKIQVIIAIYSNYSWCETAKIIIAVLRNSVEV
jgi:hypothetical protein